MFRTLIMIEFPWPRYCTRLPDAQVGHATAWAPKNALAGLAAAIRIGVKPALALVVRLDVAGGAVRDGAADDVADDGSLAGAGCGRVASSGVTALLVPALLVPALLDQEATSGGTAIA